jgi:phosphatidylinositol alpha-mannosyltransferase
VRICLVHPYAWPDVRRGGERYLGDLTRYLRGRGHDVDVITGTSGRTTAATRDVRLRHLPSRGQRYHHLTEVETFGLRAFPTLLKRRKRYDVVHALAPAAAIAAKRAGHPTLYTALGHPDQVPENKVRAALIRSAIGRSDLVAVLSPQSAEELQRNFGRSSVVLPPGIWSDEFELEPAPRTGPPLILFSAALDRPQKGLDVLLDAFRIVRERHPDARLQLSGGGDPSWALRGETDGVDVLGAGDPSEVPGRYRRATVTVLPSVQEAFGLVLVESLACGTPVVGTDSGGPASIVDDERIGRIVRARDAASLADGINACIDLARADGTPARCREHAMRWDWDSSVGPLHERVYATIRST